MNPGNTRWNRRKWAGVGETESYISERASGMGGLLSNIGGTSSGIAGARSRVIGTWSNIGETRAEIIGTALASVNRLPGLRVGQPSRLFLNSFGWRQARRLSYKPPASASSWMILPRVPNDCTASISRASRVSPGKMDFVNGSFLTRLRLTAGGLRM